MKTKTLLIVCAATLIALPSSFACPDGPSADAAPGASSADAPAADTPSAAPDAPAADAPSPSPSPSPDSGDSGDGGAGVDQADFLPLTQSRCQWVINGHCVNTVSPGVWNVDGVLWYKK